jgi:DNA-binding Lrp family transcriptional regulator
MKQKDWIVMSYLRQNARISLTKLSKKTHIPISTLYDSLKLYNQGIIKRYAVLLDFPAFGFNAKANILFKVKKSEKKALQCFLTEHHCVNSLYKVNNGFDLLAECVCQNMTTMEELVEYIEEKFPILKREVHYVIEDLKREAFLTNPELLPIVNFK